jgi:hypothetical protein
LHGSLGIFGKLLNILTECKYYLKTEHVLL